MSSSLPIVVIGAGLAGLAAAVHLQRHGAEVVVVEASDGVGGRARTDVVEGFRLDRGFQLLNTAYPEAARVLDLERLQLRQFVPGAAIFVQGRLWRVANPLRRPGLIGTTFQAPVAGFAQKARLAAFSSWAALAPARVLKSRPDVTTADVLSAAGLAGPMEERFLRPFLSGVLLDEDLATSGRFFLMLWRSFGRGRLCVPAAGMGAIAAQLRDVLPAGAVELGRRAESVRTGSVNFSSGEDMPARAVVVACDPREAARLTGVPAEVRMRAVTTFYHVAPRSPLEAPIIVLDGEERLVVNSVVLTEAAPSYSPGPGALVSTSVLGTHGDTGTETAVRRRLATLYGTPTDDWRHLATYAVADALPVMAPGQAFRQPVRAGAGLYVCGDHRDTPSIQGALVSGRRAAEAVLADLGRQPP